MHITDRTIWMTVEELTGYGITEDTIKSGMKRSREGGYSWENIPDPRDARRKLVNYDTIPPATIRKHGIPDRATLMLQIRKDGVTLAKDKLRALHTLEISADDAAWYQRSGHSAAEAAGLASSAAWLRILTRVNGKQAVRALELPGIETKADLLSLALKMISDPEDGTEPPQGLHKVTNLRVLQRYMTNWSAHKEPLTTLLHGMTGKQNAIKRTKEADLALMSLFINMDGDTKLNYIQVHATYNSMVGKRWRDEDGVEYANLPSLSLSTVKQYLGRPELQGLGLMRHGTRYYRDFLKPYILGRAPQYSFSLSSSDGFAMPFWLKDKTGKSLWKRLTCYVIFDVASQCIIGASLGLAENKEIMRDAFLDLSARHDNYMPIQNQLDNFDKFFEKELETLMMVKFCAPYNSQSKYAETFIGRFKEQVLRTYAGYIGRHSLTEKNKRNEDKANPATPNTDVGYTFAEQQQLLEEAIQEWNSSTSQSRGKVRAEILDSKRNPDARKVTDLQVAISLGIRTQATIDRGFIRIIRHGEERIYRVPQYADNLSRIERRDLKVRVRYLDHLMDTDRDAIWIFNYDPSDDPAQDRLICECPRELGTQRSGAEQTEADRRNLGRQLRWRKEYEDKVAELVSTVPTTIFPADLTREEAETMLAAGYSRKPDMMAAEETAEKVVTLPPVKPLNIGPNARFNR